MSTRPGRAGLLLLALIVAIAAAAPMAHAKRRARESDVDRHLRRGLALYKVGDYEAALVEFRAGFAVEARPELLFAMAQAERKSGDCASALIYYRRFLATEPPAEQAAAATRQRDRCKEALGSAPDDEPAAANGAGFLAVSVDPSAASAVDATTATAMAAPAAEGSRPEGDADAGPRPRDRLGLALLAGGGSVTAVGVGLLISAHGLHVDAEEAIGADERASYEGAAARRQTFGLIVTGVGVAALGYAAYRLIWQAPARRANASAAVGVDVTGGGVQVTWARRF